MADPNEPPRLSIERVFEDPAYYAVPPGVIRFDHYHTHGWWTRMQREGSNLRTFFSDGKFGSIDHALVAAVEYLQEVIDAFGTSVANKSRHLPIEPRDRIFRRTDKARGKRKLHEYWMARWYDEEYKIRFKRFAVKRYGEQGAMALALETTAKLHNGTPKPARQIEIFSYRNWKRYARSDVLRASRINTQPSNSAVSAPDFVDDFAFEGQRNYTLHCQIERDRALREAKISDFISKNGSVYCEICGFNFRSTYPFLGRDIIQVHHQTPLADLTEATKTTLNDLMLLCANCHFAIHQGDAVDNVIAALDTFG